MSENSAFTRWNEMQPAHGSAEATTQNLGLLGLPISEDTRRGYERARREFYEMGLSFPPNAGKVIRYIRCLLDVTELNSTSVQKRITALRTLQKLEGFSTMDVADEALIKQAMQAVSRIRPQRDAKRAAIMPESAVKFLFDCPEAQFEGKPEKGLVRSALLSGISLSLRSGELLRIRSQDISEILPGVPGTHIRIHLGITKVNKIEYVETSCDASKDVCERRGKWCCCHTMIALRDATARPLRIFHKIYKKFTAEVKSLAQFLPDSIGEVDLMQFLKFSGHSCRRSGTVYHLRADTPRPIIKGISRWRQDAMIDTYGDEEVKKLARHGATIVSEYVHRPLGQVGRK